MKILLVNKFHYLKGGSEKYYFELGDLLKEHGHEVAYFSMEDEKNLKTCQKEYFVKSIDLNKGSKLKALDVIYSKENYKKMIEAIEDFKPDIIHLNNFQRQLSASIVKAANKKKIPLVFTAHDVQAICQAISMLDHDNEICERCIRGKYFNCFRKKCIKDSTLKSLLGAIEGKYYRINKVYKSKIDYIITPSNFYKLKMIEDGQNEKNIDFIHNYIKIEDYNLNTEDNGYALYFGRLSKEKGILNLIYAFKNLINTDKTLRLYIAGRGPEEENIREIIKNNNLEENIKLLGFLNSNQVKEYIRKCSFVVIPSIWYENCPYSALETQAIGKPIIGSDLGGIPELVKNEENGLIYKYNDINQLAEAMRKLYYDKDLRDAYGKNAKEYAKKEYDQERYYKKIMEIYTNVLNK